MTKGHDPLPAGVDPCDLPHHGHKALRLALSAVLLIAGFIATKLMERNPVAAAGPKELQVFV